MLKFPLNIICLFVMTYALSGCIGLIINSPEECKDETPSVKIHDFYVAKPPIKEEQTPMGLRLSSEEWFKNSTKAEFLEEWGKPDEIIKTSENEEIWVYKRKLWCGVLPVLILPIPFILPVCDGFDRIEFKGNKAMRLHTRTIVKSGGMTFVMPVYGGAIGPLGEIKDHACRYAMPPKNDLDTDAAKPPAQDASKN